jgi:hypothetical protein
MYFNLFTLALFTCLPSSTFINIVIYTPLLLSSHPLEPAAQQPPFLQQVTPEVSQQYIHPNSPADEPQQYFPLSQHLMLIPESKQQCRPHGKATFDVF